MIIITEEVGEHKLSGGDFILIKTKNKRVLNYPIHLGKCGEVPKHKDTLREYYSSSCHCPIPKKDRCPIHLVLVIRNQ